MPSSLSKNDAELGCDHEEASPDSRVKSPPPKAFIPLQRVQFLLFLMLKLWIVLLAIFSYDSTGMKAWRSGICLVFQGPCLSLVGLFPSLECGMVENTAFGIKKHLHPLPVWPCASQIAFSSLSFSICKREYWPHRLLLRDWLTELSSNYCSLLCLRPRGLISLTRRQWWYRW